jgi:hypothetical protein
MEIIAGWGLTVGCFIGIITLPKHYAPINLMGVVVGVLLLQGV